ncbi:hypothetical protein JX265_008361 [Neoarthrinium moseri]|uniref:Uncharacterized protein n=1 Tax=Neoarthrinium moseri TaxID=1658444 RepID=A0A9P9WI69_9PEZI|nr:hypothetical protein JX265_008361 [Neoarthrinium moseri]
MSAECSYKTGGGSALFRADSHRQPYLPLQYQIMASLHNAARVHRVELQRMPHEVHMRHRGEDWADGAARPITLKPVNAQRASARQRKRRNTYDDASSDVASTPSSPQYTATASPLDNLLTTFSNCTEENVTQKRAILKRFAEQALASYMTADPCADHRLKIIQLNTINGFTRNAAALGFNFDWLICETISPFGRDGQNLKRGTAPAVSAPRSLMPTHMQLRTKHHPWLDLFPLPKMRDNLLMAASVLKAEDEQRLFDDVMESGGSGNEWAGLVVWGEPWHPQSWEISGPFLRNWGWLVRGCPEIIVSTNYWRGQRGEKPIANPSYVQERQ